MNKLLRFMLCAGLALLATLAIAAPPQTINYQGYLTNAGSTPVNGNVVMTFRLYNAASGGSALYNETQLSVGVANGNFNVVIGAVAPITLPFDVPYWLTVAINADGEMSPRQPLASSPYAFRAASLDSNASVAGLQVSGAITGATLPAGNLTGTLGSAQIANNAVTQAKLSPVSGAAPGKLLGTDGSNLQWQTGGVGTVTSVVTGSGLTGGPITGSGTINLAATQLLPAIQCASSQIPKWTGSAWACAADDNAPAGGTTGQVLAGTAVGTPAWTDSPSLNGNLTLANPSTVTAGNILKGANRFVHNFGCDGCANTFIGELAGNFTMTGYSNTGSGDHALFNNTTGNYNTAGGQGALFRNTTGGRNTASGASALFNNTIGNSNTASGQSALLNNTTGSNNTASGDQALYSNTSGNGNTASGYFALSLNSTGANNTAIGQGALQFNYAGNENTASGANALFNNATGNNNTASGAGALFSNTIGANNTGSGWEALNRNTTGAFNTASGYQTLHANIDGTYNTANGGNALYNNLSGSFNTASGTGALAYNTIGNNNTGNGSGALASNTSGNNNTAVGSDALLNSTVSRNIALGYRAGFNLTNGGGNIDIGNEGLATEAATIRIGDPNNQSYTYIAGIRDANLAPAFSPVPVLIDFAGKLGTISSSRRYKDDIAGMDVASSALMQLRPVTFHYKADRNPSGRTLQYGLIAEEVNEVYPGLVAHSADGQIETVMYQFLPPMLLNEVQKQQRTIDAQAGEIAMLKQELREIKAMLVAR